MTDFDDTYVLVKEAPARLLVIAEQGPMGVPNPAYGDTEALENLGGTGYAARIAGETWALRTFEAPAAGITIGNPSGIAGNTAFSLANDLAALEGLGGVGYAKRIGADAWALEDITLATLGAEPAGTAAALLAAHVAAGDPHPQYRLAAMSVPWAEVSGNPTTLAGYGIVDGITAAVAMATFALAVHTHAWVDITSGKPITLAGYGITDAYTKAQSDALYAPIAGGGYQPLDGDLTAIAALNTNGYAKRTGVNTWAINATVPWGELSAIPATATLHGITSINAIPIGATTQSTGAFTLLTVGGAPATADNPFRISQNAAAATVSQWAQNITFVANASATSSMRGITSALSNVAGAYTIVETSHFRADSTTQGVGTTLTNVYGFIVRNAVAAGTNNYAFYSDVNLNTTTWQLYMGGTAESWFAGSVTLNNNGTSQLYGLGLQGIHANAGATVYGIQVDYTHAVARSNVYNLRSVIRSSALVITVANVVHFLAENTIKGAGSTINNAHGFYAASAMAQGTTTNRGFFCDFAVSGTINYQAYMGGTAPSFFGGPIGVVGNDPIGTNFAYLAIGSGAVSHPHTGTIVRGQSIDYQAPATATSGVQAYRSLLRTINSAFAVANLIHFFADQTVKGAASTITVATCFYASNNTAVGTTNYGFFSDIGIFNASTFQLYMAGLAPSKFRGSLAMVGNIATNATDGFLYPAACSGVPTGVPTAFTGAVAMVYDRTNNHLYVYNGAWKKTTVFA